MITEIYNFIVINYYFLLCTCLFGPIFQLFALKQKQVFRLFWRGEYSLFFTF